MLASLRKSSSREIKKSINQEDLVINKKTSISPNKLAEYIAQFGANKKAKDIIILDMRKVANFCDFFILCSGTSNRQVRAIAEGIVDGLATLKISVPYKQGLKEGRWALLDLGSVVAHVFDEESREFYGLDYLWQEADKVDWVEEIK